MIRFNLFNKKLFLDLFMVFISFTIIFLYLYLRITKKQVIIPLVPEEIKTYFAMFLYFFSISCIMLGLLSFNLLRKQIKPEKGIRFFDKFLLKVKNQMDAVNIFYKSYSTVFYALSPKYTQYLVTHINKLLDYSDLKNITIILFAVVIPRLLIISIFVFELYYRILHYYFFSLLLLLIPLIFRFLLFIYTDIDKQVLPELKKLVDIHAIPDDIIIKTKTGSQNFKSVNYRFKPEYATNAEGQCYDIDHFMQNYYNPILFINPHMEVNILPLYYKINYITLWIYTGIQVLGWAYVLFYLV